MEILDVDYSQMAFNSTVSKNLISNRQCEPPKEEMGPSQ